jgi:hypothetical protein
MRASVVNKLYTFEKSAVIFNEAKVSLRYPQLPKNIHRKSNTPTRIPLAI